MRLKQDVDDLLDRLVRAGFRIDIAARVRVGLVLSRLPQGADRDTLRDALHACLLSSRIESQLFREAFDLWWDEEPVPPTRGRVRGPSAGTARQQ